MKVMELVEVVMQTRARVYRCKGGVFRVFTHYDKELGPCIVLYDNSWDRSYGKFLSKAFKRYLIKKRGYTVQKWGVISI